MNLFHNPKQQLLNTRQKYLFLMTIMSFAFASFGTRLTLYILHLQPQEIYEQMPPPPGAMPSKAASALVPTIPPHSLVAFGLFLRLPGYAEVLLKERKRAQCLLRLVLGVTDDGEGGEARIASSACAG